ncbi:MAG TPA: ion channel [Anaeromyxobacteraceae bacterium]|nr:ion channel [Anaeromyxobacteraceae bacterium]
MARRPERAARRYGMAQPLVTLGLRPRPLADFYYFLLSSPWRRLFLLVLGAYLAVNAVFALGYLALGPDAVENARPGSLTDLFFFSVQTLATVGYGKLVPRTFAANVLSTVEIFTGMMGLAVTTGLVFAKFSRPTARVLFSDVAVVVPWEGVPSLMFRMANARASQIVEANVTVVLVRTERTREGDRVRRLHDLRLLRNHHALFALTWTAIHPIDDASPLRGQDGAALLESEAALVVTLTGFDEDLAQTVHARHGYRADQVRWGHRFRDVFLTLPTGERAVDYGRFHETVPFVPVAAADGGGAERDPVAPPA